MKRGLRTIILVPFLAACISPPQTPAQTPPDTVTRRGYTAADVAFMQGMIGHHAQALHMSSLTSTRSGREEFRLLGERIRLSQENEIARMQQWLQKRGEKVPPSDAHQHAAMGHGTLMPGMLTQAELAQLANARGVEFEKLFLQFMIKHHEGALEMVRQLFATPGSGQEPELFMLANDIDADQNAEIRRMRALLSTLQ